MTIYIAPVQGHTDAAWRHYHSATYGAGNHYFTPFIRCDHGTLRRQDVKDFTSELNIGIDVEPQVIFRDMEELRILLDALQASGAERVNLNMGCPFPLQAGKGRGAGLLRHMEVVEQLPEMLSEYPELSFSAKMRLGMEEPEEWKPVLDVLNTLELRHLAVHPRVARQQYRGDLLLSEMEAFLEKSKNPVVYNGEIRTPADIDEVAGRFPKIAGVMTARGVLGRPSLLAEHAEGREWNREERLSKMLEFHRKLMNHYSSTLCGDSQVLSKIKPFWEYAEEEIGRKAWKAIRKASNLARYHSAVALVNQE